METYLEAKYHLDQRSLNTEVSAAFLNRLEDRRSLICLDLGAITRGRRAAFDRLESGLRSPHRGRRSGRQFAEKRLAK
ncbi:MAG: hypothetical protein MZV65_00585 [Chromatiales bacterium]|nr:hypothetical protein [Chromatiales bacterium]